jgi:hypothetical protein
MRVAPFVAVTVLTVVTAAGCFGDADVTSEPPTSTASSTIASPDNSEASSRETPEASKTSGGRIQGLVGAEEYPLSMKVPHGLREGYQGAGTRSFTVMNGKGGILVQKLGSLAGTPAEDVGAHAVKLLRRTRDDLVVKDHGRVEIDGAIAQTFSLRMVEGATPSDLWCASGGSCFKPLEDAPMHILAVPRADGLLWLSVEWYSPKDRASVTQRFQALVESIELD